MKLNIKSCFLFLALSTQPALSAASAPSIQPELSSQAQEQDIVKQVVQSAYIDGFANLVDVPAMAKGFHPSFEMLWLQQDNVEKTPLSDWLEGAKRRVAKAAGQPPKIIFTSEFLQIDITGSVAVVKVAVYQSGQLAYTDYLSLYKFTDGWRIVSKVGHSHE